MRLITKFKYMKLQTQLKQTEQMKDEEVKAI